MTISLYSILDIKANMYGSIMSFKNDQTAIRSFQEMLISGDSNSMLALYPYDYSLCCLGTFEQDTGVVIGNPYPQIIITGFDAVARAIDEVNKRKNLQLRLKGVVSDNDSVDSVNTDGAEDKVD